MEKENTPVKGLSLLVSKEIFRGFAEAKGRKPAASVKGVSSDDLLKPEDVCKSGKDDVVGVLANDAVCLCPASREDASIISAILKGTESGYVSATFGDTIHFFFHDFEEFFARNTVGVRLACGCVVDVKTGRSNGTDSVMIDGKPASFEEKEGSDDGIPMFLRPVQGKKQRGNLSTPDGAASFVEDCAYFLLQAGFSKDDAMETLDALNRFGLTTPLSDSDFAKTVEGKPWPDQTLSMDFWDEKKRFLHNKCARWYMDRFHVIQIRGQLASWTDQRWKSGIEEINHLLAITIPTLKKKERDEVIFQIRAIVPKDKDTPESDVKYIAFSNGILDVSTGELHEPTPEFVLTNTIPHKYNPDAKSELGEKMMQGFANFDPLVRNMLDEMIGYGMSRDSELSKVFFLLGEKNNGKSTFIDALKLVFGPENAAFLSLDQLGERFMLQALDGKLVCLGDDIPSSFADDTIMARLRTVSNGQSVTAEHKGEDAFVFTPYVTLIWSLNEMPRVSDPTGATTRRFIIVPFDGHFSKDSPNRIEGLQGMLKDNEEIAEYLIMRGIEGLKRIRTTGFTRCPRIEKQLHDYVIGNDAVASWVEEFGIDNIIGKTFKEVWPLFKTYLADMNFSKFSSTTFSARLRTKFHLDNKTVEHRPDKSSYKPYRRISDGKKE